MTTLHLGTGHSGPDCIDIDNDAILTNDVIFPGEYNPHNVRLWVIGHEFGAIVALWASNEQDALDDMLDKGYEQFLVQPDDVESDPDGDKYTYLGNAGEPCNLDYAWIKPAALDKDRDFALFLKLAESRGAGHDNLGQL